jgi:hypothetical protein
MFSDRVKLAMLFCNIWNFFIRQNSFPRCISNLMNTFDSSKVNRLGVKTPQDIRFTCEVIFIQYMCGIVFMPGGHQQFQYWFIPIVPMLLGMIGVPYIFVFWITNYLYPFLGGDPQY